MANVHRKNECSLFGNFYPTIGPVQVDNIGQLIERQVFGDVSKDSERIANTWSISDQRGGIGVKHLDEREDQDRVWFSTCDLGTKGHLLLPPLVNEAANPATADPAQMIEYSNAMYVAFGDSVRLWAEATATFGSSLVTLPATPTDVIVHKGKVYWAGDTDFARYDGSAWTNGTALGSAQKCRYFAEWDSKLFTLDNDGQLDYSIDEGVTWVTNAKSDLPVGHFTSLFVYRDSAGAMIVYMGTKVGLFALNFDHAKWEETELTMPFHDFAATGADKWFDAAFIPNGGGIIRYASGTPASATAVGPDQDDGMPESYMGDIIKIVPGHNEYFALMDATSLVEQATFPASYGNVSGDIQIYDNVGFSSVLKWDRRGWKVTYVSGSTATPAKCATIGSADNLYRLWFGMNNRVYYMTLQRTIQNPAEDSGHEYALSGENITGWFDQDLATADKTATKVLYHATGLSNTEYIKLYYGTDYDDDTWTLLTSSTFTDGKIDTNGTAEFTFASQAGLAFKAIRFKEEFVRGTSSTKVSPDRRWLRLSFIPYLDPLFGFTFKIDCRRNYRFRTARSMLKQLKNDQATKTLGLFQFKNGTESETHYVKIDPLKSLEIGAGDSKGVVNVHLVAP